MSKAWINFASYGDPSPPTDASLPPWNPVLPGLVRDYWNISGPVPLMDHSQEIQDRMSLWDQVLSS